jgi:hypothetical protein
LGPHGGKGGLPFVAGYPAAAVPFSRHKKTPRSRAWESAQERGRSYPVDAHCLSWYNMLDMPNTTQNVTIRDIDSEVWRAIRVEAVRQGITIAQLIETLWRQQKVRQP